MARNLVTALGNCSKPLVFGMVHVRALPGSPLHAEPFEQIVNTAVQEAKCYEKHGLHGVILENMHDIPYLKSAQIEPHTVACMTRICAQIRQQLNEKMLMGVQVLAAANEQALAVALASEMDFIRAEGFVFSHVADEGWMDACAGELLRYRKKIGAQKVAILTDIKKKHCSHAITSDLSLSEIAKAAKFFLSDGLILTGSATGVAADPNELNEVKDAVPDLPVIIGSGITARNLKTFSRSQAVIVGSEFKTDGQWANQIDETRIEKFMRAYEQL